MSLKKYIRSKVFPSHSDLIEILNLADSQFRDGKYVEAEKNYELWLKYYPQDAKTRLKLGGLYHTQQQIQNSYDCFEEAIKSNGSYVGLWVMNIQKDIDVPIPLKYQQDMRQKYEFKFRIGSPFSKEKSNSADIFFYDNPIKGKNDYPLRIEYCVKDISMIHRTSRILENGLLENINPEEIDCSNLIEEIDEGESSNQYEHAETILITVLSNYSRHPGIWYKLGTNLRNQKKWNKAKDAYEKSLLIDPDNSEEWYDLGITLINLKKFAAAIGAFDRVLILDPMNKQATNQKLSCLDLLNLKQATADKKETIPSQFSDQGRKYFKLRLYEYALTSFENALKINPDFSEALILRGEVLSVLNRYDEAVASFDKALEINPDNLYARQGREFTVKQKKLQNQIMSSTPTQSNQPQTQTNSSPAMARNHRIDAFCINGVISYNLGRHEEAIAYFDRALEIDPQDSQVWYKRGVIFGNQKKYTDALASYDKALEINPEYSDALCNRGVMLDNLGRHEEALACYDKALEINPDISEAWYNRGNVLKQLGRYDDALSSYDKALEFNPGYSDAWCNRGITLVQFGRYDDALTSFDNALEINPDFSEAWYNRGAALAHFGRHAEAVVSYDKAHKLNPEYSVPWYISSGLLGNLGQRNRAVTSFDDQIKSLEILLKNDPNCYPAWFNRGVLLAILGRNEDALASFDKVLEIDPNNEAARQGRTAALKIVNQKLSSPN